MFLRGSLLTLKPQPMLRLVRYRQEAQSNRKKKLEFNHLRMKELILKMKSKNRELHPLPLNSISSQSSRQIESRMMLSISSILMIKMSIVFLRKCNLNLMRNKIRKLNKFSKMMMKRKILLLKLKSQWLQICRSLISLESH